MKSNWILKGMAATLALGFVLVTDESYAQGRIGQHLRSQAPATQQTKAPQARFVDADADGVCDLQGTGQGRYGREGRRGQGMGQGMRGQGNCQGAGFVDADGNGVCDNINSATGMGRNFVDENGDGINDRSPLAQLQLTPE
ncbi:MAG: hypothetical protein RBU29_14915, partial [bacterium]|nr:hypothetical protein [bacterium]